MRLGETARGVEELSALRQRPSRGRGRRQQRNRPRRNPRRCDGCHKVIEGDLTAMALRLCLTCFPPHQAPSCGWWCRRPELLEAIS